jgi:hypothetical protein
MTVTTPVIKSHQSTLQSPFTTTKATRLSQRRVKLTKLITVGARRIGRGLTHQTVL